MRAAFLVVGLLAVGCDWPPSAHARVPTVEIAAVSATPSLAGPLGTITIAASSCDTTAVAVGSGTYYSLECWNMTSTPVYIGPTGVTTTTGRAVCTDSTACPSSSWSANVSNGALLKCIAGSAVTLRCLVGK